jgi:hypothetical protein
MWVKVRRVGKALHPSEEVVEIETATGSERLVVARKSVERNAIYVGEPVGQRGDNWLVELPRETMSGAWRVWVKSKTVIPNRETAGAA